MTLVTRSTLWRRPVQQTAAPMSDVSAVQPRSSFGADSSVPKASFTASGVAPANLPDAEYQT